MTNLEIALSYLEKGISVIPIWSPKLLEQNPPNYYEVNLREKINKNAYLPVPQNPDEITEKALTDQCKVPIIKWKEYQNRLPAEAEVREWFTTWPHANIGIVTGAISNLVVFDLDSEDAVQYADDRGGFPDTVKANTGKGYQ